MSTVSAYSHSKEASNESSKSIKRPAAMKTPQAAQQNPALIIQRVQMHPESLTRDDAIQLQKTIGNRAVIKLLSNLNSSSKPPAEDKLIQKKKAVTNEQSGENKAGLPNNLKSGLEALSNVNLSDVAVHQNSDKPAKLGALAYTQGNNIYVGPGQKKHLPHEGWHAVQQKQGRVKPTLQMKSGVQINDDTALEKEADYMGNRAAMLKIGTMPFQSQSSISGISKAPTVQTKAASSNVIQRASGSEILNDALDILQTIIDVVGFVPGVGDIADAVNVLICLLRGDFLGAAFSAIAIIPVVGSIIAFPVKLIHRALNNVKVVTKMTNLLLEHFGTIKKIISVLDDVNNSVVNILSKIPGAIASLPDNLIVKIAVGKQKIIDLANAIGKGLSYIYKLVGKIIDSVKDAIMKVFGKGASKSGSLSTVDARKWYLEQESKIPSLIDKKLPLEKQAMLAFYLRNKFRTQARELMADRELAAKLYKTDPNLTWEQVVKKYSQKGFKGDALYNEIINASQRSRTSVNESLGIKK